MNKFSLTFQQSHQESKFCHEKFQLEKFIIEKLRAIIFIISILIVINNFIYGNYIFAILYFVLGCFAQLSFKIILLKPIYLDYFILILQLLLHSLYPFLIFLDIKFGQVTDPNMAKQYIRASMIQMFSCSMMVGSKYYFKALVFIYETILQVILYYVSYPHYQYPENLYLILAGFCAAYSTYNIELSQRRYYISKEQSITFNQNILNNFPQSWLSCYYQKGLIYLGEFNKSLTNDYDITDNASFIQFCKNVKTTSKDSLFTQLAKLMINKDNFQSPILIDGSLDQQKISCNVSRYLNEDKQMLLITIKNNKKEKLLTNLQKRCELLQKTLIQLQFSIKQYFESNSIYSESYAIYRYQISFHTILCMFSQFEQKKKSNQKEVIYEALQQNIDRINDKDLSIYYKVDDHQFDIMKYHFYLLINNLIIQAIENAKKRSCIKITLAVSIQFLISPVFRFSISYRGAQIEDNLVKNLNQLCKRICIVNKLELKLDFPENCQYFAYFSQ